MGRLWQSCVYSKFGHLNNTLMVYMYKALVEKLYIEAADHAHDAW